MYEGKHIHFSEDQKPLCSCSTKVCKQRRLNGYAFCIRHILEDKSAPYYQCEFVNRYNGLPCTNPIKRGGDSKYCVSHLQVLGLVPKKAKKSKTGDVPMEQNDDTRTEEHNVMIGERVNRPKVPKEKKKKDKHKRKHEKHKNRSKKLDVTQADTEVNDNSLTVDSLELLLRSSPHLPVAETVNLPPVAARDSPEDGGTTEKPKKRSRSRQSTLQDRMRDKLEKNKARLKLQRDRELQARLQQPGKPQSPDQCTTSPAPSLATPSSSLSQPSLFTDFSDHLPSMPPHLAHSKTKADTTNLPFAVTNLPPLSASVVQAQTKKPRTLYTKKLGLKSVDSLREIYQKEEERRLDLFSLGLEHSSDEDEEDRCFPHRYMPRFPDCSSSEISMSNSPDRPTRQERLNELSARLRSQCACLVQSDRGQRNQRLRAKRLCLALIKAAREHSFGTAVSLLGLRRQPLTRPKVELPPDRTCISKEEGGEACQEEAMPYSRHCYRHILEDEHQELFHQCSAEFPGGFRCIEPAFDMQNDNPLCLEHSKRMRLQPKQKKPRKKTKPSALTRPNKKKKIRRNVRPQKPIPPAVPQSNSGLPPSFNIVMSRPSLPEDIDPGDMNLDLGIDTSDLRMTSDADNSDLNSEAGGSDLSEILPKLPMDIPDLALFESEEFTKFVKEHEEAGKNGDGDYMPIPMPTKEEQEELERAILEVSNTVNSVQESLDQLSKHSMDRHLPTSNAMFDDQDNGGDSGDQDGMDGLPQDLQSAANRLLQDTMRQNSVDAMGASMHHPVDLANSVSTSNMVVTQAAGPLHVMTNMSGQAGFHDSGGHFGGVGDLIGQNQNALPVGQLHGQQLEPLRMPNPVLMGNGIVQMNSAMLNLQRQIANSPQSPHGNPMSPHHVLTPHGAQISSAMLQQPRTLAGQPSPMHSPAISLTSSNNQQMSLPSFRQTWSVAPSPTAHLLGNSSLLGVMNQHSPDSTPSHTPSHTPNHAPTLYPQMNFTQKLSFPTIATDLALPKTLGTAFNTNNSATINSAGQNHLSYVTSLAHTHESSTESVATSSVASNFTTKASTVT
ncbi:INO80 complex subunit D-like [Acanthaster planci]|uniref:INO80 complex subunit D-like n=1 Tax=Acanthaster planci TaxID=133434 RepID=A0A8B7Y5L1_ACAPL|nr:INO80 complex subunit D-like [Acanthaster planci]XP_022088478.1 INO80 complex subunit D-like [Acanthaster planci]